jgi:glycosyltransferase involved in cell wall biosynthesis
MTKNEPESLPVVSAVIPTRNRTQLVCRAVRSVLKQTYVNIEVIVVVDGPDSSTVQALLALTDPRLRIVALEGNVGGSEARNIGAREARGEWIAFLDDDDEWLPEKIKRQINSIGAEEREIIFSATQYLDSKNGRTSIQPKCFPVFQQRISEYLFCELDRLGRRNCFLQTSTWVVRRDFFLTHPFTVGLKKNQDTDWLLRCFPELARQSLFVAEPLSIFYRQSGLKRISTTPDWEYTFRWAEANCNLFTPRALAFLFMTECARSANRQGLGVGVIAFLWGKCDQTSKCSAKLLFCLAIALLHHVSLVSLGIVLSIKHFITRKSQAYEGPDC